MSGPRLSASLPLLAASFIAASLLVTRPARAQSAAIDPTTSPHDDPASATSPTSEAYRFDGRAIYVGAGTGLVPEAGDTSFATRFNFVFPVSKAEWFEMEVGLLGQYYSAEDHHGESVSVNVGTITTGARFTLPPDRAIRPYVAPRLAHLHFFPDPYGDVHEHADGRAEHETHHRWGAGGGIGFDAGIPEPRSRFRIGVDAEAFAVTGPNVNVVGQVVALLGIGF
jgi:hypothetical protein